MAETDSIDCPCSNIAIMQLFHELKQRYPTVPDQIVSKVIQQNYHDKSACETILRRESHLFLQSYPGAIISGNSRESLEKPGSLCNQCPAARPSQPSGDVKQCAMQSARPQQPPGAGPLKKQDSAFLSSEDSSIYGQKTSDGRETVSPKPHPRIAKTGGGRPKPCPVNGIAQKVEKLTVSDLKSRRGWAEKKNASRDSENECDIKAENCLPKEKKAVLSESSSETSVGTSETEGKASVNGLDSNFSNSSRTWCSESDSEDKSESSERSQMSPSHKGSGYSEVETVRWRVEGGGRKSGGRSGIITRPASSSSSSQVSVHNYQVAVQYSMQPALPIRPGDQQRSFTTVNLSLRPPSSEPQPPIEIQSGENLTYTTSVFDAKKGVQSQLQIRISPGGGGTVSACRTYISSPQSRYSCGSPYCKPQISAGFHCHNKHHLKALLKKQIERKDLFGKELEKEKEKLRRMKHEVRLMKEAIAEKPSPHVLPKLKSEIERLRAECERLTAAVDLYSDTQNSLPLGETDEEFYRNIYTGQRLQSEGRWSCQLCTFRNHPLLNFCEQCEMPRMSLGTQVMDVASHLSNVLSNNNTSFCTGGGTSTSASLITAPLQER